MSVRVRFAPSPTGNVHIGNIRAAIFNWLFARHGQGSFLVRVEDTDRERSTPEAIRGLLAALEWLHLDIDEEIMYQSQHQARHLEAAHELEKRDKAYRMRRPGDEQPALFFRIPYEPHEDLVRDAGPAELEVHPDEPVTVGHTGVHFALVSKKGKPVPESGCLAGFKGLEVLDRHGRRLFDLEGNRGAIVRGKKTFTVEHASRLSFDRRELVFEDLVKGTLVKPLDGVKDLVIVRSDGNPVFHLANVCDDIEQEITHVIRGDDHVENTFRHMLLFAALGEPPPRYAHVPMIVNAQGKPYSKRDGDAYVGDFQARGFDPDALFNYLTLLGWSPGDDREKMTRPQLIETFTLERVRSAPSQMDLRKLTHLNNRYLAELPLDEFVEGARRTLALLPWGANLDPALLRDVAALMQSRTNVYPDAEAWIYFFADDFPYDEKAVRKHLRKPGMATALATCRERLLDTAFDAASIEQALHAVEAEAGIKEGKLNQPLRVAVTGTAIGAGLYETMALLGRDRVMARLAKGCELAAENV